MGGGYARRPQNVHTNTIQFCEESVFLIFNFVKSPFSSYWILWRVRFPHTEFYEESVFLMLNFVKCPKTDSILPLDRPLIVLDILLINFSKVLRIANVCKKGSFTASCFLFYYVLNLTLFYNKACNGSWIF